jgi:hypothetical protein
MHYIDAFCLTSLFLRPYIYVTLVLNPAESKVNSHMVGQHRICEQGTLFRRQVYVRTIRPLANYIIPTISSIVCNTVRSVRNSSTNEHEAFPILLIQKIFIFTEMRFLLIVNEQNFLARTL